MRQSNDSYCWQPFYFVTISLLLTRVPRWQTYQDLMEQQSLQLAAFLLSVSNVVLVVQDNLEVRQCVGCGTSEALLSLQFGS